MDGGMVGAPNSAITSGAAFGNGNEGPGMVTNILDIIGGIGKIGKEETQLFTGEFLGGTAGGFAGLGNTGLLSKIIDAVFAGAEAREAFAAWANNESGGGSSGGGDDAAPFSAMEGLSLSGMSGGEPVPHNELGGFSPDGPANAGRSEGIGMFG